MWSSETISCRWLLLIGLALPLGGCNVAPLYGGAAGAELQSDLAAIAIDPIPQRLGHYLGDDLIFALNGTGSHVTPKYRLTITAAERVQTPLINTFSGGQATAATVAVDANYKLTSVAGDRIIAQGTAFTAASYDRTSNNFANTSAAGDAEIRDAQTLAEQIKARIATALRNEKPQ
jgi:LPS-assembly lipoprotein